MKSTRILVAALTAVVAGAGCVPDRTSIEFAGAFAPTLDEELCAWDGSSGDMSLLAGSMNTALAGHYWLVVKLANNLPATEVSVGTTTTASRNRHDFVIREAEFTYECRDSSAKCAGFQAPEPTIVQLAGYLAADTTGDFLVSLLTPEAAQAIDVWATEEPATVEVGMTFRGDFVSGASHQTDKIKFPVTVYRYDLPACSAGLVQVPVGCAALFGQNGNEAYTCADPNTEPTP